MFCGMSAFMLLTAKETGFFMVIFLHIKKILRKFLEVFNASQRNYSINCPSHTVLIVMKWSNQLEKSIEKTLFF